MRFLACFLLCLCTVPALAIQQQPQPKQTSCCTTCVSCQCEPFSCRCPKMVTFPNGQQALFIPGPVDTKGGWPFQGPFRWAGATGRWVLGAPPRFR